MTTWRKLAVAAVFGAALAAPTAALAGDRPRQAADASHGRFDGDLGIAGSVGMTAGPRGPRAGGDLRFRYLSTAGLFAAYEDGPLVGSKAEPRRVFAFGIELRPLFLARWATGRDLGMPRLDLFIDSLAFELGAVFVQPDGASFGGGGRSGGRPGFQAGLGLELPFFATASGPFAALHGGVRWSDAALSGGPLEGPSDRALFLTVSVGWQQLFGGHVVDLGDRRKTAGR
ncbi:MAG: hypothetical protein KF764_31125 [Labilithrix sp.]|nr:hypothetical protein [Labilithrix sp.]MBX3219525.1 hypothetical protein [Labilithrix sp.]